MKVRLLKKTRKCNSGWMKGFTLETEKLDEVRQSQLDAKAQRDRRKGNYKIKSFEKY